MWQRPLCGGEFHQGAAHGHHDELWWLVHEGPGAPERHGERRAEGVIYLGHRVHVLRDRPRDVQGEVAARSTAQVARQRGGPAPCSGGSSTKRKGCFKLDLVGAGTDEQCVPRSCRARLGRRGRRGRRGRLRGERAGGEAISRTWTGARTGVDGQAKAVAKGEGHVGPGVGPSPGTGRRRLGQRVPEDHATIARRPNDDTTARRPDDPTTRRRRRDAWWRST